MNTEIAFAQIRQHLNDELCDLSSEFEAMLKSVRSTLESLAEAQFEAGRKQAFEELRHLIGAATTPGRE